MKFKIAKARQQTLTIMVGLSGSGKSYIANNLSKNVASSDSIRADFNIPDDKTGHGETFRLVNERLYEFLNNDHNAVLDATSILAKDRRRVVTDMRRRYPDLRIQANIVLAEVSTCIDRDSKRDRVVGADAIMRQLKRFTCPSLAEGFDNIILTDNGIDVTSVIREITIMLTKADEMPHDCKHHLESVGEHMAMVTDRAYKISREDYGTEFLHAAMMHDLGKVYTKVFTNIKGEPSTEAHYYGHESVSAYYSLLTYIVTKSEMFANFGDSWEYNPIEVANLIQYHMRPFQAKTEKAKRKLCEIIGGEKMYEKLWLLHEIDKKCRITEK